MAKWANPAEATKKFRLLRGQYTRPEGEEGKQKHVHHIAGTDTDVVDLTEKEVEQLGRRFLLEVTDGGIEKPTASQTAYLTDMAKIKAKLDEKKPVGDGWGNPVE